jgi:hypothetical protein
MVGTVKFEVGFASGMTLHGLAYNMTCDEHHGYLAPHGGDQTPKTCTSLSPKAAELRLILQATVTDRGSSNCPVAVMRIVRPQFSQTRRYCPQRLAG